jgi:hypothetical protein
MSARSVSVVDDGGVVGAGDAGAALHVHGSFACGSSIVQHDFVWQHGCEQQPFSTGAGFEQQFGVVVGSCNRVQAHPKTGGVQEASSVDAAVNPTTR